MPVIQLPASDQTGYRKVGDEEVTSPGFHKHGKQVVENLDKNGQKTGDGVHGYLKVNDGVVVIVIHKGKLLLTVQERFLHGWGAEIPGGGINPGESARAAAARECSEETKVTVHGDDLVQLGGPVVESVINTNSNTFFVVELDQLVEQKPVDETDPDETIDSVVWVDIDQLAQAEEEGSIRDSKTITAIHKMREYLRQR